LTPTEVGYATNQYRGAKLLRAPAQAHQPVTDERAADFRKPKALTKAEEREAYFQRHPGDRAIYEATMNRIRVRDRGGKFRKALAARAAAPNRAQQVRQTLLAEEARTKQEREAYYKKDPAFANQRRVAERGGKFRKAVARKLAA